MSFILANDLAYYSKTKVRNCAEKGFLTEAKVIDKFSAKQVCSFPLDKIDKLRSFCLKVHSHVVQFPIKLVGLEEMFSKTLKLI